MLISVRRFGIDTVEVAKNRERDWKRYRRDQGLDLLGGRAAELTPRGGPQVKSGRLGGVGDGGGTTLLRR
jgi:hypothetical protein